VDVRVDGVTDGADVMKRDGAAEAEEDPSALIAYVRACVYACAVALSELQDPFVPCV
jgi:hypothetical protein